MGDAPPADRRQLLVPHGHARYPHGLVVARDPHRGVLVRCVCGVERWSAFGSARWHRDHCARARLVLGRKAGDRGASRHALLVALASRGGRGRTVRELGALMGLSPRRVRELLAEAVAHPQSLDGRLCRVAWIEGSRPPRWRLA